MQIKKTVFIILTLLSTLGLISIIILILGYRPVRLPNAAPEWEAISAVATFLAVVAALFITKLQEMINNKKSLKIEFLLVQINSIGRLVSNHFYESFILHEICIKFVNTGNRKIIIDNIDYIFQNNRKGQIIPEYTPNVYSASKFTLPCTLQPEEAAQLYIAADSFIGRLYKLYKTNEVSTSDKIIIRATDTTNNEYIQKTKFKYGDFSNYKFCEKRVLL